MKSKPQLRLVTDNRLRAEALPVEPVTDRYARWRHGVALLAALLMHLAALATLIGELPFKAPAQPEPIPIELAYLPPEAPPPEPLPPEPEAPAAQPQQPLPNLRSGGDIEDAPPGAAPAATETEPEKPAEAPTPPEIEPETPPVAAAPVLPSEPSADALPVPPAKPPAPAPHTTTPPSPSPPQTATASPDADLKRGAGGGNKYLNAMRDRIRAHRVYPPTAELFRLTGTATYEIVINRRGDLLDARVAKSSGYELLDRAGLQTIRLSAPFEPVPTDIPGERIKLILVLSIGPL